MQFSIGQHNIWRVIHLIAAVLTVILALFRSLFRKNASTLACPLTVIIIIIMICIPVSVRDAKLPQTQQFGQPLRGAWRGVREEYCVHWKDFTWVYIYLGTALRLWPCTLGLQKSRWSSPLWREINRKNGNQPELSFSLLSHHHHHFNPFDDMLYECAFTYMQARAHTRVGIGQQTAHGLNPREVVVRRNCN